MGGIVKSKKKKKYWLSHWEEDFDNNFPNKSIKIDDKNLLKINQNTDNSALLKVKPEVLR